MNRPTVNSLLSGVSLVDADPVSRVLAGLAIAVSLGSLLISFSQWRRDRSRLDTRAQLQTDDDGRAWAATVRATNSGRRPIILRLLGADLDDSTSHGIFLGRDGQGIRLDESEWFEEPTIRPGDVYTMGPEGQQAIDLWFEDSVGRRFRVQGARHALEKLWR